MAEVVELMDPHLKQVVQDLVVVELEEKDADLLLHTQQLTQAAEVVEVALVVTVFLLVKHW